MRTYVINLHRRPDRRARLEPQLPAGLDVIFTTDWPGPLDGASIGDTLPAPFALFPWRIESPNAWWARPLKAGEIGCALSHWHCWRNASASGAAPILVLEDDVRLSDWFVMSLRHALDTLDERYPQWDLLYLGRRRRMHDMPVGDGLVRPGFSHCSYAYALSRSGLRKVLSVGFETAIVPIDELLPALYLFHPRDDVRRRYPPMLNAFGLEHDIVFQDNASETDSDTEASGFLTS